MLRYLISYLLFFAPHLYGITLLTNLETISSSGANTLPEIATATNGDAVGIWGQNLSSFTQPFIIEAAFFDRFSRTWSAPTSVGVGISPQVGIDVNGNAIAIWVDTGSSNQIFVSHRNRSTGLWSIPIQISVTGGTNFPTTSLPQISVNSRGAAIATWVQGFSPIVIAASYEPTTGTWSTPVQLSADLGSFPEPALDDNDLGNIVWQNFITGGITTLQVGVP